LLNTGDDQERHDKRQKLMRASGRLSGQSALGADFRRVGKLRLDGIGVERCPQYVVVATAAVFLYS
jgi:hypothetical protein